ncbi:MAG TPA: carbohydrate kinase family protein [Myxococcota bacterium]|nr:carbohydrate kinase family protein [Myxococcota bacterium]HOH76210.1 carbohydrate kinase family protein [Myxococcota bacterium]
MRNFEGDSIELLVVGPAFLEAFVPSGVTPLPGTEQYVPSIPIGLGGALNAASVAAALGISTGFMYPRTSWVVDGAIEECCRRTGIRAIPWGSASEPFVTLVWTDARDRAFISSGDWDSFDRCPAFPPARWVHVGGLIECRLLESRIAEAAAAGCRTSSCAGWNLPILDSLGAGQLPFLDVLFMNQAEAEQVSGGVEDALRLLPGQVARDVVVTLGSEGAVGVVGGRRVAASAPAVETVDPTGAGDAFAAAFASGFIIAERQGVAGNPEEIVAGACRVASRVVGIRGGVVIDPVQVTSR